MNDIEITISDGILEGSVKTLEECKVLLLGMFFNRENRVYEEKNGVILPDQHEGLTLWRQAWPTAIDMLSQMAIILDDIYEQVVVPMSKNWHNSHNDLRELTTQWNSWTDDFEEEYVTKFRDELFNLVRSLITKDFSLFYLWMSQHHIRKLGITTAQGYTSYLKVIFSMGMEMGGSDDDLEYIYERIQENIIIAKLTDPTFRINDIPFAGVSINDMASGDYFVITKPGNLP